MPTVGSSVHYVMANGEVRPMTIVKVLGDVVNGVVLYDGPNDNNNWPNPQTPVVKPLCSAWVTSVQHSAELVPGTWNWPPLASEAAPVAGAAVEAAESLEDKLSQAAASIHDKVSVLLHEAKQELHARLDTLEGAILGPPPATDKPTPQEGAPPESLAGNSDGQAATAGGGQQEG